MGTAGDVIKGAITIYSYSSKCIKNMDAGRSCFDSGEAARYNALRQGQEDIKRQLEDNQKATTDALNVVIGKIADQSVKASFQALQEQITFINIAGRKYREYTACMNHVSDRAVPCVLTDMNGNPDSQSGQYQDPRTVEDLYKSLDLGPQGGPVARFLFSTLSTFSTKPNPSPQDLALELRNTGLKLQHTIAGHTIRVQDGLLYALFDQSNAQLIAAQSGRPGSLPTFLPMDYLNQMNTFTQFYTNLQATYFSTVIAALQLQGRQAEPNWIARTLQDQADKGLDGEPNIALSRQSEDFSFPLQASKATPADSYFIPGDGNLYHQTNLNYTTSSPAKRDWWYDYPSYNTLALLSAALLRSGVAISRLHDLYPQAVPQGNTGAYWATFGNQNKRFQVESYDFSRGPWQKRNVDRFSGSQSPDYGVWGDNVATRYNTDCVMPVRIWDRKPTPDEVWNLDFTGKAYDTYRSNNWNDTIFRTVKKGHGDQYYQIVPRSETVYNTVVNTGAVPAYDLGIGYKEGWHHYYAFKQGVGSLYRCYGAYDSVYTRAIEAGYKVIEKNPAGGLFARLVGKQVKFGNCEDLRVVEWRGIGKRGAVDQTDGDGGYADGNKLFLRDNSWYKRNKRLDVDHDGIACEITQDRTFPDKPESKAVSDPAFTNAPSQLMFGDQAVATTSAGETVTITNTGSERLQIAAPGVTLGGVDAAHFAILTNTCDNVTLDEDQTCSVQVTFTPTSPGPKTAELLFGDNAPNSPHAVSLTGNGL